MDRKYPTKTIEQVKSSARTTYSVIEVAGILKLSRQQVYNLIGDGFLRAERTGRRKTLVHREALIEYLTDLR